MVNDSQTELLIVGSKQQLERVNMGEDQITPVTSVRNLGVIFYSNLKMYMQITKACQNAHYHLHNIRRIRNFLSQEATCMIIHAFIASQIDYCNSWMNGLPENLIKKLQRVQNTAARLVFSLRKYDRITPALVTLHWLPIKYCTGLNSKRCWSSSKDFMARHLPASKKWSSHQKAKDIP